MERRGGGGGSFDKQRAARSKMEGRGARLYLFFLAVCPLLRFKSRLRRRHSGLPRAGGRFFSPFGPFLLFFARVVAFFCFALRHGFAMGWDLLWAGLRMGAVAGNFSSIALPHAQFAGARAGGSFPLRTVRCVGTAPSSAACPRCLCSPYRQVKRYAESTSSGTWAARYLYFNCTSTSMFLAA